MVWPGHVTARVSSPMLNVLGEKKKMRAHVKTETNLSTTTTTSSESRVRRMRRREGETLPRFLRLPENRLVTRRLSLRHFERAWHSRPTKRGYLCSAKLNKCAGPSLFISPRFSTARENIHVYLSRKIASWNYCYISHGLHSKQQLE